MSNWVNSARSAYWSVIDFWKSRDKHSLIRNLKMLSAIAWVIFFLFVGKHMLYRIAPVSEFGQYFLSTRDLLSPFLWKLFFVNSVLKPIGTVVTLYMAKAFYSDTEWNTKIVPKLFDENNIPARLNELRQGYLLTVVFLCLFVTIWWIPNIFYLAPAIFILYLFSIYTHWFWWSRLRNDINSQKYLPKASALNYDKILERRVIIREFMGKNRLYMKEVVVSIKFFLVSIILFLGYHAKIYNIDEIVYSLIIAIIITN